MVSERYLRQVRLPGFGEQGQAALEAAHVCCVGAGGLGSPALLYLAAAGVGTLTVIDDDVVERTNLHRQVIHADAAVGRPKVDSAADALRALNPEVTVRAVRARLRWPDALELLGGADVVIDGSDNFDTRHIVSTACARLGIPHVWGSILGFEAQMSVFWAGHGPVYEDLFPAPPPPGSVPSCAQAGVLGPVVGIVGSAMAMEALKLMTGLGTPLVGRLGYFDSLAGTWEYIPVRGREAVVDKLKAQPPAATVATTNVIDPARPLIDVREADEFAAGHLPGARNVPLSEIESGRRDVPDRAIVYCAAGVRSARACFLLADAGVSGLLSLEGGLKNAKTPDREVRG